MLFRFVVPTVLLLVQLMLYLRLRRWFKTATPEWKRLEPLATTLFAIFNAAAIMVFAVRPRILSWPEWLMISAVYPFYVWHGATFFIGLILLCVSLIKLPAQILLWIARRIPVTKRRLELLHGHPGFQRFDAGRRVFLRRSVAGLATVSFSSYAYGMFVGTERLDVTNQTFLIPNLHPDLSGFTIGLITDVHSGVFMTRSHMEEYVATVNSLNTDLIAVVGDFVTSSVDEVYPFGEAFSRLHAPYGVVGVTGNHEFYTQDPSLVIREVEQCGIRLLRDDKMVVTKNTGSFYLIGVDDPAIRSTPTVKLDAAIGSAPLSIPRILLCHRPYYIANAADRNIDLILSGHTHGGQIVLGRVGNTILAPATIASPYVAGTYTFGTTIMYVSRGVGTVGLPVRINCPPEISKITLVTTDATGATNARQ